MSMCLTIASRFQALSMAGDPPAKHPAVESGDVMHLKPIYNYNS
jgi:hypothetical protein